MWNGLVTDELNELFQQYAEQHNGIEPDEYEDIYYEEISYEEFVGYIRKCLRTGEELPDVIEDYPPLPKAPVVFLSPYC